MKRLFYGCQHHLDMPPQTYSVAQRALARVAREVNANMRPRGATKTTHRVDKTTNTSAAACTAPPTQAICLLGRSGAGKSSTFWNTSFHAALISVASTALCILTRGVIGSPEVIIILRDRFPCNLALLVHSVSFYVSSIVHFILFQ